MIHSRRGRDAWVSGLVADAIGPAAYWFDNKMGHSQILLEVLVGSHRPEDMDQDNRLTGELHHDVRHGGNHPEFGQCIT